MKAENLVTLIGRANVGKSTLFNRLIGRRRAITASLGELTRDYMYGHVQWRNKKFTVVDTGGLHLNSRAVLSITIQKQVKTMIKESKLILIIVDSKSGITAADQDIFDFSRRLHKQIILVVNKVDNIAAGGGGGEFYEYGFRNVVFISALHGLNIDELLDMVIMHFPENDKSKDEQKDMLHIALVGRPNVGKSSFFNSLLGDKRVIVDNQPGTTRDSIDTPVVVDGKKIMLIDTAGIKRKKKHKESIGIFTRTRTLQAVKRSDVCIVLVDAVTGLRRDDLHIFRLIKDHEKCCVVAVNKCDLVKLTLRQVRLALSQRAPFVDFAYCLLCSAEKGTHLTLAIQRARQAHNNAQRKIKQRKLALTLEGIKTHLERSAQHRGLRLNYLTQIRVLPPAFVLIVNRPELVKRSFVSFVEKKIRECYNFQGTPIKIMIKKKRRSKSK